MASDTPGRVVPMPISITPLGHDLYLIDGYMHGEPERLACYLFDTPERVVVECGPTVVARQPLRSARRGGRR